MSRNKTTYNKIRTSVAESLSRIFLFEKLQNWVGLLLFTGIAVFCALIVSLSLKLGLLFIAGLLGVTVLSIGLLNMEICFYALVIYSFFGFHIQRLLFYYGVHFPVGVVSDALIVVGMLSLVLTRNNLKESFNEFAAHRIIIFLFIIYGYFLLQLFNPNSLSFVGWFQGFRKLLSNLFMLIISYHVINSIQDVRRYFTFIFALATIAGLYACIQQWHGLFNFEMVWLMSDPAGLALVFIGGVFRKMGTFSDPAAFATTMSVCAVFFMVILLGNIRNKRLSIIILIGVIIMITGMSYSGTRTGHAMLIAAICFLIMVLANRRITYIFATIGALLFVLMLYGPFESSTISRFRTTFYPEEDASYQVRETNRKSIQYYIHNHPIGGGLATTGATGESLHPGHPLANFQPDNGYLKRVLETGYIGLINYLILYFLIMKRAIRGYFNAENEEFRIIYAACLCAFFCFYIGEYAQKATGQITSSIIYYPLIVVVLKLHKFNHLPNKELSHASSSSKTE